jgi:hypothetical protein
MLVGTLARQQAIRNIIVRQHMIMVLLLEVRDKTTVHPGNKM